MLRPSYTDLLEVLTQDSDDITIGSRYAIVIAAAKRARQIVDHAEPAISHVKPDKPVSVAVHEMYEGKLKVRQGQPAAEESAEDEAQVEVIYDATENAEEA